MIGKPEKGKMVENMLLQMAQTGRLPGKISEPELIGILESVNKQTSKTTTVKVNQFNIHMPNKRNDVLILFDIN